ncbi:MAG: ATP-binding protein [Kouleothrix sp.]|nr:ATP-binding protein [Kouleothrix sp.]
MAAREALQPGGRTAPLGLAGFGRGLLRIRLFYKILLVNSAIVALGAIAGTIITTRHALAFPSAPRYELIAAFAGAGLAISFVLNYLALRLALSPLDRLQSAVDQVRCGQLDVRVDTGTLSDERFDRLAATFNQMLETVSQDSRQLHQLSQAILQAQEDERQRLARELHDEAAQALTSLLVRLRLLECAEDPAAVQLHVKQLRSLTSQALEDVCKVALELRPTILDDLGLLAALGSRVDEFNATNPARATLSVAGLSDRLPQPVELTCYRVVQEALTNVARHASAREVRVAVCRAPGLITLEVRDDGAGFDMAALRARSANRLGLRGMRERLALLGGELAIESHPGLGTRLCARLPLPS